MQENLNRGECGMKNLWPLLILAVFVTGCSSQQLRVEFDESLYEYNDSLRWNAWNRTGLYPSHSILEEFNKRIAAAENVRVVDCRIVSQTYSEERREATVRVEIDYYKVSSQTVRTLHDTQKWAYLQENGRKGWRLVSLLPEFR
jgi:hypothetical protein